MAQPSLIYRIMFPAVFNADLHCHSIVSDGVLSPEILAQRAKQNGVNLWALTDHDEVGGIAMARNAARQLDLQFVAGVEISVTWANKTIHIVGLNIDETHPDLLAGLANTRSGRERRAQEMAQELAKAGIQDSFQGALKYVGNPDLISRTHFARYLVELGMFDEPGDVFQHYLAEGKPGYVAHRWANLKDAVEWICQAGGVPVVAHPGRYSLTALQRDVFLQEFKAAGGRAIEVITGSHTVDQFAEYTKVALDYGFLASCGSDFHGPGKSVADLGSLPALQASLTPVWQAWQ